VHDLLDHIDEPTDIEIREALSGNICRCTGYGRIVSAVQVSARRRQEAVAVLVSELDAGIDEIESGELDAGELDEGGDL